MAIISVGDSIATKGGVGGFADYVFAGKGKGLFDSVTKNNFASAITQAHEGDTVIVSIGTNDWGLDDYSNYSTNLKGYIDRITDKGAKVVILGVKETGYGKGGYANTTGPRATMLNELLRDAVKENPKAIFSETSIDAANAIKNDVHGNYADRYAAAISDANKMSIDSQPNISEKQEPLASFPKPKTTTLAATGLATADEPAHLSRNAIRAVQSALNQAGLDSGKVDGKIGKITRGAWSRFESSGKEGTTADGIIGKEEIHKLFSGASLDELTATPAKTKQLQTLLTDLGYDSGKIDGIRGPVTEKAFQTFQAHTAQPTTITADASETIAPAATPLSEKPVLLKR